MYHKIWKIKPKISDEANIIFKDFHPLARQLLYNRGFKDSENAEKYLRADYEEGIHSPFLFLDMEKAVNRICQAVKNKEKICIYGDYDADAVTASAVLCRTLKILNAEVFSYIPDRFSEGYGVNLEALDKIKQQGANLIITVDCGTNSRDAADWCLQNQIDFIITDHHEMIGSEPKSFALINPKNPLEKYPFRELTGVGVAFKVACGILESAQSFQLPSVSKGWEKWLLDLAAIGTVADCHSLVGENRILVKYGLKVLVKSRWPGLKALCLTAGLDFNKNLPDAYTLGFVLAPRLNAAGRLEHAGIALDLLLEDSLILAGEKALNLEKINTRRQDLTARVLSEAREKALLLEDRKVLVISGEGWPKGIMGLVAGKLAEEFLKPTIVLESSNGEATGSARTAGGYDIIDALKYSDKFLKKYGGHKQAAGLSLGMENFSRFYNSILAHAENFLVPLSGERITEAEAELDGGFLDAELLDMLDNFAPFGYGNPVPKFFVSKALVEDFRPVGALGRHLQINLALNGKKVSGIAFRLGDFAKSLKIGDNIDVLCELIRDNWNGYFGIKLRITDIKISE